MKVLFLARWYPDKYDSMFGLFIQRHAEAVARFSEVSVLYVNLNDADIKPYELDYKVENNIGVLRIYCRKSSLPVFKNIINACRYFRCNYKGYHYFKKLNGKPDIIHVNVLTRTALLALCLKVISFIPYIITEHWSRYQQITDNYKGFFRKVITKYIVRNASAITTVTANLKKAMLSHKLYNKKYYIIPNVVVPDIFITAMKSVIRNPKSAIIKITHVSCFEDKSKNISGIIRTIKKLSDIRQDFECIFIGDGIDKPKLEKYSADLGLNNKFIFYKGLLTGNDLANELSESDFLLMFSNYENMPVVINESLACGVPVISSNVGGIAEYLKPDFGLLVEPRNEDALLSAIIKMMDNYQNYDKNKLHDFAKNNFTYDIIGKQFLDIYKNSIN